MAGAAAAVSPPVEKADATAWIAVAAGALGAMLATLDISIVNSALPTIQGEIGATGTEGTWIATAFLVAEIIIIPLSAWLERLLGLRTLLIVAVSAFTAFSVLCGIATDLTTMIIGRTGQGFMGGALIPTAMTIVAKRLPPSQQPIGMALFGMTVVLGPVMGPLVGGWLTENLSWHYAFFVNVPVCALLLALLFIGLPHEKPDWVYLREADWAGIAGMILGLGGLTIVLEEGHREEWFEFHADRPAHTDDGRGFCTSDLRTALRAQTRAQIAPDAQQAVCQRRGDGTGAWHGHVWLDLRDPAISRDNFRL